MAQRTTKTQVNGYRFLFKRLEHALVRRDVRMIHDPMGGHIRSMTVGVVLTALIVGAAVALSFFKPQGSVGDSKILVSKSSGALYVLINDELHPALNLASARLATGTDANPNSVADSVIAGYARGPAIGIPGAPSSLAVHSGSESLWAVCDDADEPANSDSATQVAVIGGSLMTKPTRVLTDSEAVLARNSGKNYLLFNNTRAEIDTTSFAVRQAFGLQDARPRPISAAVLNAFPVSTPIAVPAIDGFGTPARWGLAGTHIGSVIKVAGASDAKLYVVLATGVQEISTVVGDMILAADTAGSASVVAVAPGALASVPQVHDLDLSGYPSAAPKLADATSHPVMCLSWSRSGADKSTNITLLGDGYPVANPAMLVDVVGSASGGPTANKAYIPPGAGYFTQTTGSDADSSRADGRFYISDTGVRYGIAPEAAQYLGLSNPVPSPYPIVSLLPSGPTLSRDAALVARTDIVASGGQVQSGPAQ